MCLRMVSSPNVYNKHILVRRRSQTYTTKLIDFALWIEKRYLRRFTWLILAISVWEYTFLHWMPVVVTVSGQRKTKIVFT